MSIPAKLERPALRLLAAAFRNADFTYSELSSDEKKAITRDEFEWLLEIVAREIDLR
jgi:hypothetical protein